VLQQASPDAAARVADGTAPERLRTFTGLTGYVRRAAGAGWALVGDAGYWKDPIGAHGLTDALRDAELLARAVIDWKTGGVPQREALEGYGAERDRLSHELFTTVDAIAGFDWDGSEISALLLRLSASMVDEVEAIAAFQPIGPRTVAA
jgi:2-polyprenyl-6-methoxyphenol hydroxylase-like FAD-dependent oxidoreductase